MRLRLVFGVMGRQLQYFAPTFLAPLLLALWDGDLRAAGYFVLSLACCLAVGTAWHRGYQAPKVFWRAEALGIVAGTWLAVAAAAAVPFLCFGLSPVDAYFEAMSGLTTTGATILQDFGAYPRSFFFWRSMVQWFGGIGVIALFVVVLPRLGIAGRQLLFAEASRAPGEAIAPQIRETAWRLWALYGGLTTVCMLGLMVCGLGGFDALCHALTTLSAGGFSPNSHSIAGFGNSAVEWWLILFMFLAGASFPLQYLALAARSPLALVRDGEFMAYLAVTLSAGLMVALVLGEGWWNLDELRAGLFQVASLISSTGFASVDYNRWPDGARGLLLVVMLVGGCAGSAAGGQKVVRHLFVVRHIGRELTQALHPRAVLPLVYNGRLVPHAVMRAVFALAVLYVGGYFVLGLYLVLIGHEPIAAFSASVACLGNIGPGFGDVGPMGSFAHFDPLSKLVLTGAMWLGRLEIVTVLALLHPHVLRRLRFSG